MMFGRAGLRALRRAASPFPLDRGQGTNTIQAPHVVARLNKALGIREMAPIPEVARAIQPVIIVDDVSRDPGTDERDAYFCARASITPGAGDGAGVALRNVIRTGGVIQVDAIFCNSSTGQEFGFGKDETPYPTGTLGVHQAFGPRPTPTAGSSRSTFAQVEALTLALSVFAQPFRFRAGGGGISPYIPMSVALAFGQALIVAPQAVAQTADVTFLYRERPISQ